MSSLSKINFKVIFYIMGLLLLVNGVFMLLASGVSLYYNDGTMGDMIMAGLVAFSIGGGVMLVTRNHKKEVLVREGYIIVTCGWIVIDRKSTRLNSSHVRISYAVFCLKKKK